MIFRVSEIGHKKRKRKKASLFYLSSPPHFLSCCRLCHGKDQATLLRPRVNGQRRTFGVRVRFVRLFFCCCCFLSLSFSFVSKGERSFLRLYCSGLVLMNETNSCTDARIFVRSPFPLARLLAGQIPRSLLHHLRGVHVGRRVRNPTVQNNLPAFRKHRGD